MKNQINSTEEIYQFYGPCSVLEQLFKACVRCLGGDHDHHDHHQDHKTQQVLVTNSPSQVEREMKTTKQEEKYKVQNSTRALKVSRRPPVNSGNGARID